VEAIFADDITGIYGTDWVLFRYNPTSNSYEEVGLQDVMQVGQGYWIINTSNTAILDMPANSLPVSKTAQPVLKQQSTVMGLTSGNYWQTLLAILTHGLSYAEKQQPVITYVVAVMAVA
jgi:hypothetical protein